MSLSTWDDDDQQTSDALQSSIYSHNTELTTTTPAGQGKSSGYEPNQFQRAQSSLNNNLITHNNDFSDMRALEAGSSSTGASDDGNWDETSAYKHDFKSYCTRYLQESVIIGLGLFFALCCFVLFLVFIALKSTVLILIFLGAFIILGAASGFYSWKFWTHFKQSKPFSFST
jgi:hypothetical protein